MLKTTCHCGNVTISLKQKPATLRLCDCPICNRLGAVWADMSIEDVDLSFVAEQTTVYNWGDNDYDMHHCKKCGCTTHYSATKNATSNEIGINFRMFDPSIIKSIPIQD